MSSNLETSEWKPSNGFIGIDKRRSIRKSISWSIDGQWDNGNSFEAVTDNVSISGIMIITNRAPQMNDRAMLKIKSYLFGESFVFNVIAEVKHICLSNDMYHIGMQFTKTTQDGQNFIRDFVSNRNPHEMRKRRARIAKEAANQ